MGISIATGDAIANSFRDNFVSGFAENNHAETHGSAIFFVSNDHSGSIVIEDSTITGNTGGSWYPTHPQISNHADTPINVSNSTIE